MDYSVVTQSTVDIKINQADIIIDLHINVNDGYDMDGLLAGLEKAKDLVITGYAVENITNLNGGNMVNFSIIFDGEAFVITNYPADLDVYVDGTRII